MSLTERSDLRNLTFILGGARSGKSTYAESLAQANGERVLYVATAEILDDEMKRRVEIHQSRRPVSWSTLDAPMQVAQTLENHLQAKSYDAILLDCVSLLTSNILLTLPEESPEANAWEAVQQELAPILAVIRKHAATQWILVSNEVGQGIVPAYSLGRLYRDVLGRANQFVAANAGNVFYMIAGLPMKLKG